jgi:enoyl-CoA hydratase/carnithine racemase
MGEFVELAVEGATGTIQLRHRPRNALTRQVQEEIRAAAAEAAQRLDVRAVVVHGGEVRYGGRPVFSVGADVAEMAGLTHAGAVRMAGLSSSALSAVADIPKPTVAAVTGYALGGGLELALCCDRRIAARDAVVGLPEIRLGIIPGAGGTQRLARVAGISTAKDLVYTGRLIGAEEALALGIVDEVVDPQDTYAAAHEWAALFTSGPALALSAAKSAIDAGFQSGLAEGLRTESHLFATLFATEDQKTGMRSYLRAGPGEATFSGR